MESRQDYAACCIMTARWLSLLMGMWFASLQAGYYLLLETHVTATYLTYFLVIGVWLFGTINGLHVPLQHERWFTGLTLLAFYVAASQLRAFHSHAVLFMLIPCVMLGGMASGQFFLARQRLFPQIGQLFFWENTGFLFGWIVATIGWLWLGEAILLWMPFVSWCCAQIGVLALHS